jgi:hypothetical protein
MVSCFRGAWISETWGMGIETDIPLLEQNGEGRMGSTLWFEPMA